MEKRNRQLHLLRRINKYVDYLFSQVWFIIVCIGLFLLGVTIFFGLMFNFAFVAFFGFISLLCVMIGCAMKQINEIIDW